MIFVRFDLGSEKIREEIVQDLIESQIFLRINHYFYLSDQYQDANP